ncbi:uncharacterized protein [Arachis hypogaea]|uniref:uncharacterized protein n=1 Tax=Arachis hypogaea TaxID=3818 RepID=UPI003B21E27E
MFAAHEVERQGNANSKKKDTDYSVVDVIENGVISSMELTVKKALALPPGKKIVLHHNRELQQVGQAAGLLNEFLGTLGSDFQQLPKELEDNEQGFQGACVYDEELTFEENIKRKPAGIEANHWKKFLQYRLDDDTKEAIELIESQDPSSKKFSQNDSLAQVLGKKHPGRVHGLDIGTCLSRCFRNISEQSDYGVQIEEYQMEIVKLKAEAAELKAAAAEEKTKRQRMETRGS